MTNWLPSNKHIVRTFIILSLVFTAIGFGFNALPPIQIILAGMGFGLIFTLMFLGEQWSGEGIRKSVLSDYQKSEVFRTKNLKLVDESSISGEINGYGFKLRPTIGARITIRLDLQIELKDGPQNPTPETIDRALKRHNYRVHGSSLYITNWSPRLLGYGNLERVLKKLEELLDTLE